ncbi:MAG TPA: hypothetical protein VF193_01150 [Steroidobacter sp.]
MSRRFRKWVRWLLPLLAARAILPVGFMLTSQDGDLRLVLCPDQNAALVQALEGAPATGHADHSAHLSHQPGEAAAPTGGHTGHHGDDEARSPLCPYAAVATFLLADLIPEAPVVAPLDEPVHYQATSFARTGPVRADRIRGPPVLS